MGKYMNSIGEKIKRFDYGKYKPGVDKKYLLIVSGIMWSGVGIFLDSIAVRWIFDHNFDNKIIYFLLGLLLGFLIHKFGFSLVARKNIQRIILKTENKACLFSFQKWSGYAIIVFMMSLGMFMRRTPYIPKTMLSVLYLGIGSGLFFSSFKYYKSYLHDFKVQKQD